MRIERICFLLLLVIFFSGAEKSVAQIKINNGDTTVAVSDTTDIDELFKTARQFGFSGNTTHARRICSAILDLHPAYYDVRTFMARTHSWDKNFDEARTELSKVLIEKPDDYESLSALIDVETWTEQFSVAMEYLKIALGYYPTNQELLMKKAKIQLKQGDRQSAAATLQRMVKLNPGNKDALNLLNTIANRKLKNYLQVLYSSDFFDKTTLPQSIASLEYGRSLRFGSVVARVTHANKFNTERNQYELDGYINLAKGTYIFLNAGYSYNFSTINLFPNERFAGEFYRTLPANFEVSIGARYLEFAKPGTLIYTAYVGNFFRDYWFAIRTFITPPPANATTSPFKDASQTFILSTRYYLGDADNFIGVHIGSGQSPDSKNTDVKNVSLKAMQAGAEFQRNAFSNWSMKAELNYSNEETGVDVEGLRLVQQRITVSVTLKTIF